MNDLDWRYSPSSLDEFIGNERAKDLVATSLSQTTKPQVILIEGDSGCGKTTFARLVADRYNLECNTVEVTLPELNVVDFQKLFSDENLQPKVVIFDECDLASSVVQNSLVKYLEEPLQGVLIILCVTDSEYLVNSVKTRCQLKITLDRLFENQLIELLSRVCKDRNKDISLDKLSSIAKSCVNAREALCKLQLLSEEG